MLKSCGYCQIQFEPKRSYDFFCDTCEKLSNEKRLDRCKNCDEYFELKELHLYICDKCHGEGFTEVFTHTSITQFIAKDNMIFDINHYNSIRREKAAPCWVYAYHPNGIKCQCAKCVDSRCSCSLDQCKKVKCLNRPEYDPSEKNEIIQRYDMHEEAYALALKCEQHFFVRLCPYVKSLQCPVHKMDYLGGMPLHSSGLHKPLTMCPTCQQNGFHFGDFHGCMGGGTPAAWIVDMATCVSGGGGGLAVFALSISHKEFKKYHKHLFSREIDVYEI